MKEYIVQIITMIAPLIAGLITSIVIPAIIQRFTVKRLGTKIDAVKPSKQHEDEMELLNKIYEEILAMRGKHK